MRPICSFAIVFVLLGCQQSVPAQVFRQPARDAETVVVPLERGAEGVFRCVHDIRLEGN